MVYNKVEFTKPGTLYKGNQMRKTQISSIVYTKEDKKLENAVAGEINIPDPDPEKGQAALDKAKKKEDDN